MTTSTPTPVPHRTETYAVMGVALTQDSALAYIINMSLYFLSLLGGLFQR